MQTTSGGLYFCTLKLVSTLKPWFLTFKGRGLCCLDVGDTLGLRGHWACSLYCCTSHFYIVKSEKYNWCTIHRWTQEEAIFIRSYVHWITLCKWSWLTLVTRIVHSNHKRTLESVQLFSSSDFRKSLQNLSVLPEQRTREDIKHSWPCWGLS